MTTIEKPVQPTQSAFAPSTPTLLARGMILEDRILAGFARFAPMALRVSLAVVFVWFGALKVAGVPTLPAGLIAAILPSFVSASVVVPAIGAAEVVLGAWLLTGWRQPLVLVALMAHLAGTLLVLAIRPDIAFQDSNVLMPSPEGEFVIKNLVLMAGLATLAGLTSSRALAGSRRH